MIACRLHHLEARCRERGYTLDGVRACIVSQDGDAITVDETSPAYPRAKPGPGLLRKAGNFAAAAARHVAAGMPQTSDAERERRFSICQGCEFYDGSACSKCGCDVVREARFLSKLSWAGESCPEGKWSAETRTEGGTDAGST
jgi:hypothetical protein